MSSISHPRLETGWKTANMIRIEKGGTTEGWKELIRQLEARLVDDFMEKENLSVDEAAAKVNAEYAGMRNNGSGPGTPSVSPKGFALLPDRTQYPPLHDWQTASGRRLEQGGSSTAWAKRFKELGQALASDIVRSGAMEQEEAEQMVERFLIGIRQPATAPATIAASADAQRLLPVREQYPPLEDGWETGAMMRKSRNGGDPQAWRDHIRDTADEMVVSMVQGGDKNEQEARAWVDKNIAGIRQPENGKSAWAASPRGQELVEARYQFKRRRRRDEDGRLTR